MTPPEARNSATRVSPTTGIALLIVLAVAGLFYVKWFPYYQRAFVAFTNHSIGRSILMGTAAAAPPPSLKAALDYAFAYGKAIWQAMLLGLLLGSALQEFAPRAWVARALGRPGFRSVTAGALLALPGMMCTCCAAPVVIGLRRHGASPAAASAFWLGNTMLNPATFVFAGFVLGWQWAGLRLGLGIALVFGLGYLISIIDPPESVDVLRAAIVADDHEAARPPSLVGWWLRFWRLFLRLVPEYLVLVLLVGAARAWLFPVAGPDIGNTLLWIVVMTLGGLIMVIPTAGEVPIVQAMLALGVGVGPAAALMMTLAPVSLPSLFMTKPVFSFRVLGVAVAAVISVGILAGCLAAALF
jgi:uncharacterized membrane protein YraQ (UPF0718 family)